MNTNEIFSALREIVQQSKGIITYTINLYSPMTIDVDGVKLFVYIDDEDVRLDFSELDESLSLTTINQICKILEIVKENASTIENYLEKIRKVVEKESQGKRE